MTPASDEHTAEDEESYVILDKDDQSDGEDEKGMPDWYAAGKSASISVSMRADTSPRASVRVRIPNSTTNLCRSFVLKRASIAEDYTNHCVPPEYRGAPTEDVSQPDDRLCAITEPVGLPSMACFGKIEVTSTQTPLLAEYLSFTVYPAQNHFVLTTFTNKRWIPEVKGEVRMLFWVLVGFRDPNGELFYYPFMKIVEFQALSRLEETRLCKIAYHKERRPAQCIVYCRNISVTNKRGKQICYTDSAEFNDLIKK